MNYNKKTVKDFDPQGKRVLLRCDFNVPLDGETGDISNDKRIVAALPTIEYLLDQGASVIACSHLGKPKGEWRDALSLAPVAKRLSALLGREVIFVRDLIGDEAKAAAQALKPGEIMLLENLRFDAREEKNDADFARALAAMADVYVSDAFGTVHRAHASTAGVAVFLPAYAGLLVEKELSIMGRALADPARPFVAVLGGAKISDKLGVIESLLDKADTIIIGGGMAYTFLKAKGYEVGHSLLDEERLAYAAEMMRKAQAKGVRLLLPVDIVVGRAFDKDTEAKTVAADSIPADWMGLDCGEQSRRLFAKAVADAGTVVWNGPLGVFEFPAFAGGTWAMAEAVANCAGVTIVGGGDSVSAIEQSGFADKITHVSTGGGASLEFLEGIALPGVTCLLDK